MIMRWLLSFLILAIVAVVKAASFTGNRLLVVLDEQAEREKYSVFLDDLTGKCIFFVMKQVGSCSQAETVFGVPNCCDIGCSDRRNRSRVSLQVAFEIAHVQLAFPANQKSSPVQFC